MAKKTAADQPESFEKAMAELEGIVGELEASRMPLTDLVGNYERGTQLLRYCQDQIQVARQRVESITANASEVALEEFTPGSESAESVAASKKASRPSKKKDDDSDVRLF